MAITFEQSTPIEFVQDQPRLDLGDSGDERAKSYIVAWRNQLKTHRLTKRIIWDECWELYRGKNDFNNKQDWQTKIVLPKAWASVKQATNIIKRLLGTSKIPWTVESINPEDLVQVVKAEMMTELTRAFMDKAHFLEEFSTGLETGFVLGVGIWKLWWGLVPRTRVRVENQMIPAPMTMPGMGGQSQGPLLMSDQPQRGVPSPFGQSPFAYPGQNSSMYPPELGGEALNPFGWGSGQGSMAPQNFMQQQKSMVREEVLEGRLFIRAVDPYNFYWLPGSKLNRWTGTIEDVEVPKWQMLEMAKQGMFDEDLVKSIKPMRLDEYQRKSQLRWDEPITAVNGPTKDTGTFKLTEFFGPLVIDSEIVEENAHVVLANDTTVLLSAKNPFIHRHPPYIGFSPLSLPFRTEGVGLIEMVRTIDKALSELANLSVDTLLFKLMPLFEVTPEVYENPEDLETGMTPGKILRKNLGHINVPGITPIGFEDVSQGAIGVAAELDRAHQEGAMVSEIQQSLPRWRGAQTATETQLQQQNQDSFMGSLAADIENQALRPMVEMAVDLIFQFIDTANDPRIASILGVGADVIAGMSKEEIVEMIQGDYKIKAIGLTGQLQKAEMLQNLVQLMNLIGQNPQAWIPYINQDALLRRVLEAFRPAIHDIENIIADPATAQARESAMHQGETMKTLFPTLITTMAQQQQSQQDMGLRLQELEHERQIQSTEANMQKAQQAGEFAMQQQELAMRQQELDQKAKEPKPPTQG